MEDYSRNLEKELSKYSVPNPFRQSRNWQLLFISDDGKTISIKKYKGLVITLLVVLTVALLFSCGLSILYYKSLIEKKTLKLLVKKTTNSLNLVTQEKEMLNTRLFFLNKGEKKNVKIVEDEEKVRAVVLSATNTQTKPDEQKTETIRVSVTELLMTKEEGSATTKIRFIIRNLTKIERIAGRVFVVLKPDSENMQNWLTIPPVLLRDGEPSASPKGRFFSINNFKSMYFQFNDENIENAYKDMTIFVYSKNGEKIFESNYPVKIDLIKNPNNNAKKISGETPPAEEKKMTVEKIMPENPNGAATKTSDKKADKLLNSVDHKKVEIINQSDESSVTISPTSTKGVPENEG